MRVGGREGGWVYVVSKQRYNAKQIRFPPLF
jgi:hypothetical protein